MYFAVSKLRLESSLNPASDSRDLTKFIIKLRNKFKVAAMFLESEEIILVVSALGASEHEINRKLDNIIRFCESSGIGRIDSDETLLDDVDLIDEYQTELGS